MAHPLYVAFIWHQHQPLYKSKVGSSVKYRMPWVRLHGTKDYLDLILMLERYPNLHQTVNLVPSLILQLEDYVAGTALDPYLTAALTPSDRLAVEDKEFIIQSFFDCNHHTMIDPHPRYGELYQQKQDKGSQWCLENWNLQDYEDLLAWHNLAWIDPLFWDDPEIEAWLKQGRNFTLSPTDYRQTPPNHQPHHSQTSGNAGNRAVRNYHHALHSPNFTPTSRYRCR
jgi:alpha-amylase/alpha-mannosidase (GH57 family)